MVDKHTHFASHEDVYWKELWRFREIIYFLTWRDLIIRYKQTVIGVLWTILRPVLLLLALTLVFGKFAKLELYETFPYPLLVLSGLLPWQFFSNVLTDGTESLIANSGIISKIYFPRLIIPLSRLIVTWIDFSFSLCFLFCAFFYYNCMPSFTLLLLPLCVIWLTILTAGVLMWVSSISVKYRDFRFIVPFFLQFGLYMTPVAFSLHLIPDNWKLMFSLNPLVGVIECFRFAVFGTSYDLYLPALFLSFFWTALLFATGLRYFRNMEMQFADII